MVKVVRPIPKVPNTPVRRIIRPGNWRLKNEEPLGYDEFGSPYWNPQLSSRWSGKRMAERRDSSISDEVTTTAPKRAPRQDLRRQSKTADDLKEDFERGSSTRTPRVPWGPWPSTVPDPELPGEGDPFEPSEDIETPWEEPPPPPEDDSIDQPKRREDELPSFPPCATTAAEHYLYGLPYCGQQHAQVQIQTKKFQKHRKTRSAYHKGRNRYYPF